MIVVGKIIAIHAACGDLKFLCQFEKTLSAWVGNDLRWHCLNSVVSHEAAKQELEQTRSGVAIILLHGRSDGFRAGDYDASQDDDSPAMFMNKGQLEPLRGKAVFCLSCKGNEHAAEAIQKGARVFVGFDDVPFYRFDPVTGNEVPLRSLTKHCQGLILSTVTATFERLIHRGASFDDAIDYLRLWVRRAAVEFVRNQKSEQHRNDIAYLFLKMEETVRVHGDGKLRFGDLI